MNCPQSQPPSISTALDQNTAVAETRGTSRIRSAIPFWSPALRSAARLVFFDAEPGFFQRQFWVLHAENQGPDQHLCFLLIIFQHLRAHGVSPRPPFRGKPPTPPPTLAFFRTPPSPQTPRRRSGAERSSSATGRRVWCSRRRPETTCAVRTARVPRRVHAASRRSGRRRVFMRGKPGGGLESGG